MEFGARSTGEPREEHPIECDALRLILPDVGISIDSHSRHVGGTDLLGEGYGGARLLPPAAKSEVRRLSRHWYDLVRLDDAGFAEKIPHRPHPSFVGGPT